MKRSNVRPCLAYIVNTLNPGGTEKLVVEMSLAFSTDFNVLVLCLDEPGLWANDLRAHGIPVHCCWRQPGFDLAMPISLAKHFRQHQTQIVHAHQCTPWFYAALSRLFYATPRLLLEEHGRFFPELKSRKRILINRLLIKKLTHRFVAVSEDIRRRLQEYEGLDADQIEVIYNGVQTDLSFRSDAKIALRRELGLDPDCFVVGTIGRFDPIKNLTMLVKSIATASQDIPTLCGLLIGNGPVFSEISSLVKKNGLSDRIKLPGFRNDARIMIQCMDLFVLSSFSEGTSMALLEAMAAGVPIVVTDVGGNPEIVIKNQTGWVVPSDSVEDLANVIIESAKNKHKRLSFGTAGKLRFTEKFSFERMIESYRQRYQELLSTIVNG